MSKNSVPVFNDHRVIAIFEGLKIKTSMIPTVDACAMAIRQCNNPREYD